MTCQSKISSFTQSGATFEDLFSSFLTTLPPDEADLRAACVRACGKEQPGSPQRSRPWLRQSCTDRRPASLLQGWRQISAAQWRDRARNPLTATKPGRPGAGKGAERTSRPRPHRGGPHLQARHRARRGEPRAAPTPTPWPSQSAPRPQRKSRPPPSNKRRWPGGQAIAYPGCHSSTGA